MNMQESYNKWRKDHGVTGDYYLKIWQDVWKARGEHDAKICFNIFDEFETTWRKNLKSSSHEQGLSDGAFKCEEAIRNDAT